MADVQPLRALHYDLAKVGSLDDVAAPPYDVIDPEQRRPAGRALALQRRARRPARAAGPDPYAEAATIFERWQQEGAVVRDDEPALWTLTQDYTGPDGRALTRHGVFARVRVEDYGPGRIRPHERTHPGPKEDRLRLTRATKANLSPIFSLYDDPTGATAAVLQRRRALRRADRRRRHRQPAGARDRPRGDRGLPARAGAGRAAHRRRPPPLRDRARLRRGGRRRGRAPLRAHVPRRAAGRGADRLPHPPPHPRHHAADPGGAGEHAARALHRRGDRPGRPAPARRRGPADHGLHRLATSSAPSA